jgi:hypothetical protein
MPSFFFPAKSNLMVSPTFMERTSAKRRPINKEIPMKYQHEDRLKNKEIIRIARFCQSFLWLLPGQRTLDPVCHRWIGAICAQ